MPWAPELFSASVLDRIRRQAADARAHAPVPYFAGVRSGEVEALVESFAGEPELHHPVRGRVKGRRAFEWFVAYTNTWWVERNVVGTPVQRLITPRRGIEETVLTFDGEHGRTELPLAIVADRADDGRIIELRLYYSTWPFSGKHANRAPVLQPDPDLREPDVVGDYLRALAAGDVEATVATFEPDAYVQEREGYVHRGHDELVALYRRFFTNGGGIPLERCTVSDDGRACALEYNIVRWGRTELLPPEAGLAVYVRGAGGKLAGVRIYDDADPSLSSRHVAKSPATDGGNNELKQ
jgi:SnoaL-like domain